MGGVERPVLNKEWIGTGKTHDYYQLILSMPNKPRNTGVLRIFYVPTMHVGIVRDDLRDSTTTKFFEVYEHERMIGKNEILTALRTDEETLRLVREGLYHETTHLGIW